MTAIKIKNRRTGNVLFESEKENNTIIDVITEAVKQKINLRDADLCGANLGAVDLCGVDLCGVNLIGANLYGANLVGADLRNANLCESSLIGADLRNANLCEAKLYGADLRNANLRKANLCCANLYKASLIGADLYGADLCKVKFCDANLAWANLGGSNLCGADLCGANIVGSNLVDAKNIPHIPYACPSDGAFIGWKTVDHKLIKLEIPEDARRCSATSQKCRCDKAKVLSITNLDGENPIDEILNTSQKIPLLYKVGEIIYPDSFDDNRWIECSHGIHFFINKQDAIDYAIDYF
jgi:uncharacterized protein YjbI with pentapeptide repeats